MNFADVLEGTGRVYISLVDIIVKATLVLSAVIVVFVIYLLVRTMLSSKKRDYGIQKALGFTAGQLVFNILAGAGVILFAFGAACLMSLRVKRITPRELLTGE